MASAAALPSPYLDFTRDDWAARRDNHPLSLTPDDVARVTGLGDRVDLHEVGGDAVLRGPPQRLGAELVVAVAGAPQAALLADAVDMPTPVDGGPPVGYAVVDPDRTVRYATLDPAYLDNAFELDVITGAVQGDAG